MQNYDSWLFLTGIDVPPTWGSLHWGIYQDTQGLEVQLSKRQELTEYGLMELWKPGEPFLGCWLRYTFKYLLLMMQV